MPYSAVKTRNHRVAPRSKNVRLDFQCHAEFRSDIRLYAPCQAQQLTTGGLTIIDQHQRLVCMDTGVTVANPLPASSFDQPAGRQLHLLIRSRISHQIGMLSA